MTQFSLPQMTPCVISDVNVRSEKRGSEHIPAVDLTISMQAGNDVLIEFDPQLLGMLYERADDVPGTQAPLDGVPVVSDLSQLRTGCIESPLRLATVLAGYALTVDSGLGGGSNIAIDGCIVDRFRLDCQPGGIVGLVYRVRAADLSAGIMGRLAMLIDSEVSITLLPPDAAR